MSDDCSLRLQQTEEPYIENLLEKYADKKDLILLALGSTYWSPPEQALSRLLTNLPTTPQMHKYGGIFGLPSLRSAISTRLTAAGLSMEYQETIITPGANQAFANIALALCDSGDHAIVLAPYYFSHCMSLQIAGAQVSICPFDKTSFLPQWDQLQVILNTKRPRVVVMTTPNNPSGCVWPQKDTQRLVDLCKAIGAWLVVDQTYFEFIHEDAAQHWIPCAQRIGYDRIVHVFSFSKSFGIPGWRVGYAVCPQSLVPALRKLQDAYPTHATIASQYLAQYCLEEDAAHGWVQQQVKTLAPLRKALFEVLRRLGTVYSAGAIYFLVPLPPHVSDDEAVDILAISFGVLVMHGSAFGAPGYLRLSYGSLRPELVLSACTRLHEAVDCLLELSTARGIAECRSLI